jgi:HK97 family phage portal protein
MNLFGFTIERKADLSIDQVLRKLEAVLETAAGISVSPENCEEAPTVQAIVNAVSMHLQTLPVHVIRKSVKDNRETKEKLQNHPVAKLLAKPNEWQTSSDYWGDLGSVLVRHGRFLAVKGRGVTGPIRRLYPVHPGSFTLRQDANDLTRVTATVTAQNGGTREYEFGEVHYVRSRSKDFLNGESPVWKCRDAIALEIAAQRYGASFFGNGAMPGIVFKPTPGTVMTDPQRDKFMQTVQAFASQSKRFKAMLLPRGIETADPMKVENDKAQFLETRKLQRSVIAGAFGVPPHLVGDLERGTFSNIEHQSQEFHQKVMLPYVQMIEDAMERDLLTAEDRASGVAIRFNMDATLRADFKTRQEGLNLQRQGGALSANEWREVEGRNPIPADQGGDTYWQQGPSGQNGGVNGEPQV